MDRNQVEHINNFKSKCGMTSSDFIFMSLVFDRTTQKSYLPDDAFLLSFLFQPATQKTRYSKTTSQTLNDNIMTKLWLVHTYVVGRSSYTAETL
jgi:hypothetical protein